MNFIVWLRRLSNIKPRGTGRWNVVVQIMDSRWPQTNQKMKKFKENYLITFELITSPSPVHKIRNADALGSYLIWQKNVLEIISA